MLNNKVLIENIRKLCDSKGIKITNLEKELGFGAGIINRWGNEADPSLSKVIQVANYFHVSLDDIVGLNNVNDDFLEKLIEQTIDNTIEWKTYDNTTSDNPKQYFNSAFNEYQFLDQNDINEYFVTHKELSYFCDINNGFISLYALYSYDDITTPDEIKLFIQATPDSRLIEQKYIYEQLKTLWLKVIYTIRDNAPDEIKAEDLKNQFVLNVSKSNSKHVTSKKTNLSDIQKALSNPDIIKVMEVFNQPAFQELRKTFSNPEFQAAIQAANKLQHYFDNTNH